MRSRGEIWRQRPWIWVPALVFFLVNGVAFSVYKLGYAGRVEKLDDDIKSQEEQIQSLKGERKQLETMIERVRTNGEQVQHLYADRLSTRSRRLTGITREVKELAKQAGLVPRTFTYPEEELQDYGLIKRSFVFPVQGTYPELRKFIHLIELSHSFLSIEEVTVASSSDGGPELKIDLTLSTLFAMDAEDGGAAVPSTPAARAAGRGSGAGAS